MSSGAAISRPITIAAPEGGRDHGPGQRRFPGQDVGAEQDPEHHERDEVDRVEDDQEGDHPADGLPSLHPGLAQGPIGEQDAPAPPARNLVAASPAIVIW
jgi:hypothetical protein